MDPKLQGKLEYAVDVEERITNLLAKGIESLILTKEEDFEKGKQKRLLEILKQIKKETQDHLKEIEALIN